MNPRSVSKQISGSRSENPLFVIGLWRSGTSLLYALLNQHPEIQLFYESDLPVLWPLFVGPARTSWASRLDFWNGALRRHRIDPDLLPREADFFTAFAAMGAQYAGSRGASVWGCKSPNYYVLVPKLAREFPAARYLFVWRDPVDICGSIVRAGAGSQWFRRRGMWRRVLSGCAFLRQACEDLRAKGINVHEIYYTDLVNDTEHEMRRICSFLGLEFTSQMTSLQGADLSAVYDGDHHELLRNASGIRKAGSTQGSGNCSPKLKAKIERYKAAWQSRFPDWRIANSTGASANPPGRIEKLADQAAFGVLWGADFLRRYLFTVLPLWVWRLYRRLKGDDVERLINSPAIGDPLLAGKRRPADAH